MFRALFAFIFVITNTYIVSATDELPIERPPRKSYQGLKRDRGEGDLEQSKAEGIPSEKTSDLKKPKITDDYLVELYNIGLTYEQMSKKSGLPRGTMKDRLTILRTEGRITNRSGTWTNEKTEKLQRLVAEGKSRQEIATTMGIAISTVNSNIKKLRNKGLIAPVDEAIWTQEKSDKLVELHNSGLEPKHIAVELELGPSQISNKLTYLRKQEKVAQVPITWTAERVEDLKRLYQSGKTSKEIAIELGMDIGQVKKKIQLLLRDKQLIKKEDRWKVLWPDEKVEKLIKLREEGKSYTEIAEELDMERWQISNKVNTLIKNKVIKKLKSSSRMREDKL